ncbi:protein shisa-5-like isoform X3 [Carassius carassius]|uniref:protein shisa-5-like isoform X3 n=1 Tax=Carassius carassius TaxID=217509 RepID=UPI0028696223|nr:protein shisa-5-like isoform X3 [Carassius carassius]
MPKPSDVMITTPVYQQQQYEVSKFLKTKPLALGILEILITLLALGLMVHNESFYVFWSPIIIFPDVTYYVLIACDILIFIFSLAIAVTSCSCCCNPKSTPVMVSYVTTDMPVNCIMLMGQPDPSAVVQSVNSVMYMQPAAHGLVTLAPLPNYGFVPNASPPIYSPVPTTPPPSYDKLPDAPPPNFGPAASAPPPAYEYEDLQTRR